jgi:hypothetical protein
MTQGAMTRNCSLKAQEAHKEELAAIQQIKKQWLIKKKQHDEERKQEVLVAKRREDVEAAEQASLSQTSHINASTRTSRDQHDPEINKNLLDHMNNATDVGSDKNKQPPPLQKQRGLSGTAISCPVSPTKQGAPVNPQEQAAATNSAPPAQTVPPKHIHCFKHAILAFSVILKMGKAFDEFLQGLIVFMVNAKMVNPYFVWNPINPNAVGINKITSKGEISTNMTMLGSHVKVLGNGYSFVRQWVHKENKQKQAQHDSPGNNKK